MNILGGQAIKIAHHNREIDGVLYVPQGEERYPIVIFSHGYNGHKSDFASTAQYLAEQGIGALCYTFCGGSIRDESNMPTTQMTLFTEVEDLLAVIAYVQGLQCVDKDNLFVFGASQGGLVTALAVDEMSDVIKGMILLYPAFCIADNWKERFPNVEDIPDEEDLWGMKLGRIFFESIHDYDVFEHVGQFSNNLLVMHGNQDDIVPLSYSERICKKYANVELKVFEGERHGFSQMATECMTGLVYEFVRKNR